MKCNIFLTLSANEDKGYFSRVTVLRHFRMVTVNSLETRLTLQAEYEDDRIHPGGELYAHTIFKLVKEKSCWVRKNNASPL